MTEKTFEQWINDRTDDELIALCTDIYEWHYETGIIKPGSLLKQIYDQYEDEPAETIATRIQNTAAKKLDTLSMTRHTPMSKIRKCRLLLHYILINEFPEPVRKNINTLHDVCSYIRTQIGTKRANTYWWTTMEDLWSIHDLDDNNRQDEIQEYDKESAGYMVDVKTFDIYDRSENRRLFTRINPNTLSPVCLGFSIIHWYNDAYGDEIGNSFATEERAEKYALSYMDTYRKDQSEAKNCNGYLTIKPVFYTERRIYVGDTVKTLSFECYESHSNDDETL